jgi:hypothetical protein
MTPAQQWSSAEAAASDATMALTSVARVRL